LFTFGWLGLNIVEFARKFELNIFERFLSFLFHECKPAEEEVDSHTRTVQ